VKVNEGAQAAGAPPGSQLDVADIFHAVADRRHRLRLGEDLGVRPDADFEADDPLPAEPLIPGAHNRENAAAATAAGSFSHCASVKSLICMRRRV
jgi:hypothetical protein